MKKVYLILFFVFILFIFILFIKKESYYLITTFESANTTFESAKLLREMSSRSEVKTYSISPEDDYKDVKMSLSIRSQEATLEKEKKEALAYYESVWGRVNFDGNEHDEARSTISDVFRSSTDMLTSPSRSSEDGVDMEDNSAYQPSDEAKGGSNKQDVENRNNVLNKIEKVRLMIKNEQDNSAVTYLKNFMSLMQEAEFRIQNHQYERAKDLCNRANEEYSKWKRYKMEVNKRK